jgi:glycosyltransferase involved in cell wall biosynthesis
LILITHPNRQHSHQAALALQAAGRLAGYWAGAPSRPEHGSWVPRGIWRRFVRYSALDLPLEKTAWAPVSPAVRRLSEGALPAAAAAVCDYWACRHFDRWAAHRLRREAAARGVIACEISALTTFAAARRSGMVTLLDAPSFHHTAQDALHGFNEPRWLHRRIVAVKNREIAAADHVVTVSELARRTYVDAGVPAERVHAVSLGADLELFRPDATAPRTGPLTFAFVGASIRRKGFDLLVQAFARVRAARPGTRLRVIGPRGELGHLLDGRLGDDCAVSGPMTQSALAAELRRTDCLVLPSRNDSFGMAVAEALACGLPVIVSEMVGAKDLVREGESGWVVASEDVAALADRMTSCASSPDAVRAMAAACRRAAERATWAAYRERFASLMALLVDERS